MTGFIGFIGVTAVFLVASLVPFFKNVKNNEVRRQNMGNQSAH